MNGGEVLKRFRKAPSDGNKDPRSEPKGNRSSWKHLQKLQEAAVKNRDEDASKRLSVAIHSLQTFNEILNTENDGLKDTLAH